MKVEELLELVPSLIENRKEYNSILIDGDWGCGKTTLIKDIVKQLNDSGKKVYYQSLFGINNVIELEQCFRKAGIVKKIAKATASFIQLVPIEGEAIYNTLDKLLDYIPEKSGPKSNKIFIFDDFERVGPDMSYLTLLGFFNQLILKGCTVICISSIKDVKDGKRKKEIDVFMEKSFDRIFKINEAPETIIKDIFKLCEIKELPLIIKEFDNNLRTANRVYSLYQRLSNSQSDKTFKLEKYFDKIDILRACIATIRSIYVDINYDEKEIIDSFKYLSNKESPKPLDDIVFKKLFYISKKTKLFPPEIREKLFDLSSSIIYFDLHNDISDLIKDYPPKTASSSDKKDKMNIDSFFYLSDEGKIAFYKEFREKTLNGDFVFNRQFIERFVDICRYSKLVNDDNEFINYITKTILHDYMSGNTEAYNRLSDYAAFNELENAKDLVKMMLANLNDRIHSETINNIDKTISETVSDGNYDYLQNLLIDIADGKYVNKQYLIDWFFEQAKKNNYWFPDLSKTIDRAKWGYCHSLCKYFTYHEDGRSEFVSFLGQEKLKHKDSNSAQERLAYLLKYYFNL